MIPYPDRIEVDGRPKPDRWARISASGWIAVYSIAAMMIIAPLYCASRKP